MKATKKKGGATAMPSIGAVSPPPGAVVWSCWRVKQAPVVNPDTGRKSTAQTRKRCDGEPQEDGSVPQLWKVDEFSTRTILEWWGPGKYMVEWWSKTNEKIAHHYLTVGTPRAEGEPTEDASGGSVSQMPGTMAMPTTPMQMMLYLQQREDMAREQRRQEAREEDERRRQEYERNAQRDRDFMTTIITAIGRPATSQAVDSDLLRREMNLAIRESVAGLRGDVAQALERIRDEQEEEEATDDPKDMGEGLERIALRMLKELEDQAPELIQKAIPAIVALATRGGRPLSPGMKRAIDAARKGAPAADE